MYSLQWEWEYYTRMEIYAHEDIKYLILGEDYNSYGYNYIGAKKWNEHYHHCKSVFDDKFEASDYYGKFRDKIL